MGLTIAKCPACGAELNLEVDKDYFYCPHCGSKVLKQDERIVIEHVIHTVDEAKVKREELKQAKVAAKTEEKRIEAERKKALTPFFIVYAIIMGLIALFILRR